MAGCVVETAGSAAAAYDVLSTADSSMSSAFPNYMQHHLQSIHRVLHGGSSSDTKARSDRRFVSFYS